MENELLLVWQIVNELSEQLVHNQKLASALQSQAVVLHDQAAEANAGFNLRRVNADISQEVFQSEIERQNAQIIIENQTLLHENKQLSMLLKEYEGTMGTIMAKFRNHALAAQHHEHNLTRHYESLLHSRQMQTINPSLMDHPNAAQSLCRLTQHLKGLLKTMAGEDCDPYANQDSDYDGYAYGIDIEELQSLLERLSEQSGYPELGGREDWTVERESEIARLEKENEELRRLLGIDQKNMEECGVTLDLDRIESGKFSTFLSSARRSQSGSDPFTGRPSYWDGNGQSHSPSLNRPMDLQPGMRGGPGTQVRRPGIFGAGQQRGGFSGSVGRGVSMAVNMNPGNSPMWSNQPSSPSPLSDRHGNYREEWA